MDISAYVAAAGMLIFSAAALLIAYRALTDIGWLPELPNFSIRVLVPDTGAAVVLIFVVSRVLLYTVGMALTDSTGSLYDSFVSLWSGPDTEHYVRIAMYGYEPDTEYANLIVFYPLFPMLIRLFSFVFQTPELSGIIISNICFAAACLLLYRLCLDWNMSDMEAVAAVAFMTVYPFSFFSMSCYTESLFLMLTIGSALALRRKKWLLAGVLGMLAALTRTQGVLLFAMALYEGIAALRNRETEPFRLLPLFLIPLGLFGYLCINRVLYGSFFAYLDYEAAAPWYQGTDWIWNNLKYNVSMAEQYPGLAKFIYIPQLVLFFAVLWILAAGVREAVAPSLLIYGGLSVAVCYTASWLISGGRYIFAVFPVYIVLAKWSKRHKLAAALLIVTEALFLVFYMLSHLRGEAVM